MIIDIAEISYNEFVKKYPEIQEKSNKYNNIERQLNNNKILEKSCWKRIGKWGRFVVYFTTIVTVLTTVGLSVGLTSSEPINITEPFNTTLPSLTTAEPVTINGTCYLPSAAVILMDYLLGEELLKLRVNPRASKYVFIADMKRKLIFNMSLLDNTIKNGRTYVNGVRYDFSEYDNNFDFPYTFEEREEAVSRAEAKRVKVIIPVYNY